MVNRHDCFVMRQFEAPARRVLDNEQDMLERNDHLMFMIYSSTLSERVGISCWNPGTLRKEGSTRFLVLMRVSRHNRLQ